MPLSRSKKSFKRMDYRPFTKILLLSLVSIIVLLWIIYKLWVYPLRNLHILQTKEWITDLTKTLVLGAKDPSKLASLGYSKNDISFWYCYWYLHTKRYTIWVLFQRQNKFNDRINTSIYLYDFETGNTLESIIPVRFKDLETFEENGVLRIRCKDVYEQHIDMQNNRSTLRVNTPTIQLELDCSIDDYTTNQPSFLPRYRTIRKLVNVDGKETETPEEWMSDNPFIGKVKKGKINGDLIESGANFWFDNFIGTNNMWLSPYIWFVILNDDWLIYLLWYGTKEEQGQETMPFIIKDRKNNRVLHAGMERGKKLPFPMKGIHDIVEPFHMSYDSQSTLGEEKYDKYTVSFESNKLKYKCRSIPGESHKVIDIDYYKNEDVKEDKLQGWDKDYYRVIANHRYIEYVNLVEVEIEYEGKLQRFQARQIIDAMYPKNPKIPHRILYQT